MIERLIPRREVLAFIALTTDEASAPNEIEFREYVGEDGRVWRVVEIYVDSEAAVRFWMGVFGHEERYLFRSDRTGSDGIRYTSYRSQSDGWRGFTTVVQARVNQPADVQLDVDTVERLRAVAGEVTP